MTATFDFFFIQHPCLILRVWSDGLKCQGQLFSEPFLWFFLSVTLWMFSISKLRSKQKYFFHNPSMAPLLVLPPLHTWFPYIGPGYSGLTCCAPVTYLRSVCNNGDFRELKGETGKEIQDQKAEVELWLNLQDDELKIKRIHGLHYNCNHVQKKGDIGEQRLVENVNVHVDHEVHRVDAPHP